MQCYLLSHDPDNNYDCFFHFGVVCLATRTYLDDLMIWSKSHCIMSLASEL